MGLDGREVLLKFHHNKTSRTLKDLIFPPCLFLDFLIDPAIVSEEREYLWIFCESSTGDPISRTLSRLHLWRFLMDLKVVTDEWNHPFKASMQVLYGSSISRHHFSSMSLPWVLDDMEDLEIVLYNMHQPSEVAVKISSKSIIRKLVKTLPVLQVPSWSLGGHGGSWIT